MCLDVCAHTCSCNFNSLCQKCNHHHRGVVGCVSTQNCASAWFYIMDNIHNITEVVTKTIILNLFEL